MDVFRTTTDLEKRIVELVLQFPHSTRHRRACIVALAVQELEQNNQPPTKKNILNYVNSFQTSIEAKLDRLLQIN